MNSSQLKKCRKCLELKPLSDFHLWKALADGHQYSCKKCVSEYMRSRYLNDESVRERLRISNRKVMLADLERLKLWRKRWRAKNKLAALAMTHRRQARLKHNGGSFTQAEIRWILEQQKNKCVACKKPITKGFQIDHIQPLVRGGSNDRLNIQLLCRICNGRKGGQDPINFMQSLGRLL